MQSDSREPGAVEKAVREFIASFSELDGPQATFAEMALRLAREYDTYSDVDMSKLARANMELRQTMTALADAARSKEDDEKKLVRTPEWTNDGHRRPEMPPVVRDAQISGTPDVGRGNRRGGKESGKAPHAAPEVHR